MAKRMRKTLPNWRITVIRGNRAQEVGTVSAADAQAAIKTAIKEYRITDRERQKRLATMILVGRPC